MSLAGAFTHEWRLRRGRCVDGACVFAPSEVVGEIGVVADAAVVGEADGATSGGGEVFIAA